MDWKRVMYTVEIKGEHYDLELYPNEATGSWVGKGHSLDKHIYLGAVVCPMTNYGFPDDQNLMFEGDLEVFFTEDIEFLRGIWPDFHFAGKVYTCSQKDW